MDAVFLFGFIFGHWFASYSSIAASASSIVLATFHGGYRVFNVGSHLGLGCIGGRRHSDLKDHFLTISHLRIFPKTARAAWAWLGV
jgi:hypothetical protein